MKFQWILLFAFLTVVISTVIAVPVLAAVIYVTPEGYDGNDGLSWVTAKASIQAGIDAAEPLDEVWVAAGKYTEAINLRSCIALYGGFTGNEVNRSQRNWKLNTTTIDGNQCDKVVTTAAFGPPPTRIDGFTITGGKMYGVYCTTTPTVANNTISGNRTGLYLASAATVVRNNISHNLYGIYHNMNGCRIAYNVISHNSKTAIYGGLNQGSLPMEIVNNFIIENGENNSPDSGGGIDMFSAGTPIIANNVVANNTGGKGSGILLNNVSTPIIINNTIVANSSTQSAGISITGSSANGLGSVIANNIVCFNSSGILSSTTNSFNVVYNCVYGNTSYNYSGVTPDSTNISLDPQLVSLATGDYHLQLTSPCINSGSNSYRGSGWLDMDGNGRIYPKGGTVDIGADEYVSDPVWSPGEAKRLEDGQQAVLTARGPMSVTAAFPEIPAFYVQQSDRTSGIQCRGLGMLEPGQAAVLIGTMGTVNWERVLLDASVVPGSFKSVSIPTPLGLYNRSIGGGILGLQAGISGASGLNNIGLLIKTTGRVVEASISTFIVDDGSGEGVKVVLPAGVTPPVLGSLVAVTGISSCEDTGTGLKRLLRVRNEADVQNINTP